MDVRQIKMKKLEPADSRSRRWIIRQGRSQVGRVR